MQLVHPDSLAATLDAVPDSPLALPNALEILRRVVERRLNVGRRQLKSVSAGAGF